MIVSNRTGWLVTCLLLCLGLAAAPSTGQAATIQPLHRFAYFNGPPSHYAQGASPYAELTQASDGNFYGTTTTGGAGLCPNTSDGGYLGCGAVFRMTPQGAITVIYSFPYVASTRSAPDGAFPTAGLIQGRDGYLYGVAQDGGIGRCNGTLGCGTVFRISTSGIFVLLHQFCGGDGCSGVDEGGRPITHLVQAASGLLYGTTEQGGVYNDGTIYAVNLKGGVTTLHYFQRASSDDGNAPEAPLLLGADGQTLYGTTTFGGVNGGAGAGGGIVFSIRGLTLKVLHSFDNIHDGTAGTSYEPIGGLIFGTDGKLYGTTSSGGNGGVLYSLTTAGADFNVAALFNNAAPFAGSSSVASLVLGRDGLMYGTTLSGSIAGDGNDGAAFSFNPITHAVTGLANFTTITGAAPRGALIEGRDRFLYGTTTLYGDTNRDAGSVFRIGPPLKK